MSDPDNKHDIPKESQPLISRRSFLGSATAAGALAWATGLHAAETGLKQASFKGSDIVSLGKTGIKVSRLAQGTGFDGGNKSSAHTRMGAEAFSRLLNHSLDQGVNFIDMADLYGSHPFVKETIKTLPRDKYVLLTKLWPRKASWNTPSGGARQEMDRYRQE